MAGSGATLCTATATAGLTIVATPIGGAVGGTATAVATSGAFQKYTTKLAKKYPCLKEMAKQQAALHNMKKEMIEETKALLKEQRRQILKEFQDGASSPAVKLLDRNPKSIADETDIVACDCEGCDSDDSDTRKQDKNTRRATQYDTFSDLGDD